LSSAVAHNQAEKATHERIGLRDEAEQVLLLSRHLTRPDFRRVMVLRYREGWKTAEIAESLGLTYDEAFRAIHRLTRLVTSREFILSALFIDKIPLRLRLACECLYLSSMTLRDVAKLTGKTLHQVRAEKREIEGIAIGVVGSNTPSYRGRRNIPNSSN
jgi:hypothetical protein